MDIQLKDGQYVKVMVLKEKNNYEYYIEGIRIGVYNPKIMDENILMLENTLENELANQIKDVISKIDRPQIEQEAKQNEELKKYMKKIGEKGKIKDIYIIDLEEKKEKQNKEAEKDQEENINKTKADKINIKQEIELDERASDIYDLRKWLGEKIPPEFTKIAVIESDQMKNLKDEKGNSYENQSTRYSLAIVDKDNNIEPLQKYLPELKQRDNSGNNPIEEKYQIDTKGNVEKDAVLSEYELGRKIIQIDNKEMGRVEVNIGKEERGGNKTLTTQMRDRNTLEITDKDIRSTVNEEYSEMGEDKAEKGLEEVEQHEKNNCNTINYKDIDGNKKTKSHKHINNISDIKMYVNKLMENPEISRVFTEEEVEARLLKKLKKLNIEKIVEETESELEEDAGHIKTKQK